MLFNSIEFAVFLPLVFLIYWFFLNNRLKAQNLFIILSSYIFYGWWDWKFLFLIIFSSTVDYFIGLGLAKINPNKRKLLLVLSITINIGILGVFKYYNFFIDNFISLFSNSGIYINEMSIKVILPVGISFYTFQTLSYSIDIYNEKIKPTNDIIAFFAFVSFFPQLVAGPIERAKNLLPQFYSKRKFDSVQSIEGLRLILWGLFKKMVIADNCAFHANEIFSNYQNYSGLTLFVGAFFFAFQIYGDFSGYSDIAIGTAKLFGFSLMNNFSTPYFSRDIAEFWRRWHVSLSTWFRDYVYIPLGGSKVSNALKLRNIFIIFILSGFWHGANWTFIVWGLLHAIYYIPLSIKKKNRVHLDIVSKNRNLPSIKESYKIIQTFFLTTIAWIFFRSDSLQNAFEYILHGLKNIFVSPGQPLLFLMDKAFFFIIALVIIEWTTRNKPHPLYAIENNFNKPVRWVIYLSITLVILWYNGDKQEFIYFQF